MKTIRDLVTPPANIVGQIEFIFGFDASRGIARVAAHEHLSVIAQLAHIDTVDPIRMRRNLEVCGINLVALRNARVRVGDAILEIIGPCAPCSRMEEEVGPGAYAAMRGHGGMTARIIESGEIRVGDSVRVA